MKKLQSTYPLGQAIIAIINGAGLKLPDFLRAIGYRNVNKGIRTLHRFLSTGFGNSVFIDRIMASPYAPRRDVFHIILEQHMEHFFEENALAREDEQERRRRRFRPFVQAIPALSESASITLFAVSGGFARYRAPLPPKFAKSTLEEQCRAISSIVQENCKRNEGQIRLLGPIKHYLFFHSWDAPPIAFSVEGEMLGIADGAAVPALEFTVASKRVSPELLQRLLLAPHRAMLH